MAQKLVTYTHPQAQPGSFQEKQGKGLKVKEFGG